MTKTEKILACGGKLLARSIAKVVGCSPSYVYNVLSDHDIKVKTTDGRRSTRPENLFPAGSFPQTREPRPVGTPPARRVKKRKMQRTQ